MIAGGAGICDLSAAADEAGETVSKPSAAAYEEAFVKLSGDWVDLLDVCVEFMSCCP
jgi:hypothetical protein